jgi:hypothetical protein
LGMTSSGFKVLLALTAEKKVASAPIDLTPEVHEMAWVGSATNLCNGVFYADI